MTSEHFNKVANITWIFWVMKIVSTTLGETFGDFLSMTLDWGYTVSIFITLAFFLFALFIQLSAHKFVPVYYWLTIISTTTFGTEISDFIDRTLHLGYATGSLLLMLCLFLSLFIWYRKYKSLNVYPIINKQKEIYYWVAILFSNSLGTAFGDYLGEYFGISYLTAALITGCVIFVVLLLHYFTNLNHILLFWMAFIFTRPFGATFGDFLTKPIEAGGLDLGTLQSTLVSVVILGGFIIYSQRNRMVTTSSPLDDDIN